MEAVKAAASVVYSMVAPLKERATGADGRWHASPLVTPRLTLRTRHAWHRPWCASVQMVGAHPLEVAPALVEMWIAICRQFLVIAHSNTAWSVSCAIQSVCNARKCVYVTCVHTHGYSMMMTGRRIRGVACSLKLVLPSAAPNMAACIDTASLEIPSMVIGPSRRHEPLRSTPSTHVGHQPTALTSRETNCQKSVLLHARSTKHITISHIRGMHPRVQPR